MKRMIGATALGAAIALFALPTYVWAQDSLKPGEQPDKAAQTGERPGPDNGQPQAGIPPRGHRGRWDRADGEGRPGYGPPPWAGEGRGRSQGPPPWADDAKDDTRGQGYGPPPWAGEGRGRGQGYGPPPWAGEGRGRRQGPCWDGADGGKGVPPEGCPRGDGPGRGRGWERWQEDKPRALDN
jgi:hypothetical protein